MADKRSSNLAEKVLARLSAEIRGGRLAPGARLPTEQELTSTMGVSRTVVREAVAALRADGLVVTRRGSGAYVADNPTASPFRIAAAAARPLARRARRHGAAPRGRGRGRGASPPSARSRKQVARGARRRCAPSIARCSRGEGAVAEDFAFHRAIAEATGNAQFPRFLAFLGSHVIPRQSVRLSVDTPAERRAYLERIQQEHGRIVAGIAAGDPVEARRAMRDHLTRSLERYRKLAEGSKSWPRTRSRRIVFTGAAGGIGTMTRPLLAKLYPGLVLSDRVKPKNLLPGETFVKADLTKPDEVAARGQGRATA